MHYSIDIGKDFIGGWLETYDEDFFHVTITSSKGDTFETISNRHRPDVLKAGLTENVNCGFRFSQQDINLIEGNFYTITIKKNGFNRSVTCFFGDKKKWQDLFEDFQVADRRDFTIQDSHYSTVFKNNPDLIAFKLLMIRLRRGKRAYKWRGHFEGHFYSEMSNDWQCFRDFYVKYFDSLRHVLSIRSLWSVMDTFADFGSEIEKLSALTVSNYMYQERFAQTFRRIYKFELLDSVQSEGQTHFGSYMLSNQLKLDDAYDVFLSRTLEVLEICPVIKKTFCHIFLWSLSNEMSINYINSKYSSYFNEAFEFYKKLFHEILAVRLEG